MSSHWLMHALKLSLPLRCRVVQLELSFRSVCRTCPLLTHSRPCYSFTPVLEELVHPEHVRPVSSAIWSQQCARRDVPEAWRQGGSRGSAQVCGPAKRLALLLLALSLDFKGHVNRVQTKVYQVYVGFAWWRQCREVEVPKLVYVGFPCSCHIAWAHTAATAD